MRPGLAYAVFQTRLGWVAVWGSSSGLAGVALPRPTAGEVRKSLPVEYAVALESPGCFRGLIERLQRYFEGCRVTFDDNLDTASATAFQRLAWESARRIPYGETRSYGWLARQIGRPQAARAVGQAMARNPFPIIVPCHRVLACGGKLGGFSGGLDMKMLLLAIEHSPSV